MNERELRAKRSVQALVNSILELRQAVRHVSNSQAPGAQAAFPGAEALPRRTKFRLIRAGVELAVAAGLFTCAIFILRGLREIRLETAALTSAVASATAALKQTTDNSRQYERPILAVESLAQNGQVELVSAGARAGRVRVGVRIKNYGRLPAVETAREAHVAVGGSLDSGVVSDRQEGWRLIAPGESAFIIAFSGAVLTEGELERIRSGKEPVTIHGAVEYTDVFSEPTRKYQTSFCVPAVAPRSAAALLDACNRENALK